MACDRNITTRYTAESIEKILRECKEREKEQAVFEKEDKETEFLRRCLSCMEETEREILEKIYIEGVSVRGFSSYSGFSRNFITKQCQKSIALLVKFFNLKFA